MRIIGGSARQARLKVFTRARGSFDPWADQEIAFRYLTAANDRRAFSRSLRGIGIGGLSRPCPGARPAATFVDRNPAVFEYRFVKNLIEIALFDHARVIKADASKNLDHVGGPRSYIYGPTLP